MNMLNINSEEQNIVTLAKDLKPNHHEKIFVNQRNIEITISTRNYISMKDSFLLKARDIVENNLNNSEFRLEIFAHEMQLSVSTLARKFKKYLKITPNKFIVNIRLKHARQMLISDHGSVRKISQNVGFEDCKYFSRCFKAEFGLTPNEVKKQFENTSLN